MTYHVYSPLLEGYVAMDLPSIEDANRYVKAYREDGGEPVLIVPSKQ